MPPQRNSSQSSSPPPPPPSGNNRPRNRRYNDGGHQNDRRHSRRRTRSIPAGYDKPRNSSRRAEQNIVLVIFRGSNTGYHSRPLSFDKHRSTDEELWVEIRRTFRSELERPWRRLLLFKKLKAIAPIEFTTNGVPKRQDPSKVPNSHQFMHCYHHPRELRSDHEWIDWWVDFKRDPEKTYGLEFVEGLWAEKLAAVAAALITAIIVVSVVWCVKGGNLQTVFTVMGFVLTGFASIIALIALYYQVTLPG